MTHEQPDGDPDGDRYHRSPHINTIRIRRDTSRLSETGTIRLYRTSSVRKKEKSKNMTRSSH